MSPTKAKLYENIAAESKKLKEQEQILKVARKSLKARESQVIFKDMKQKKSVRFFDEYSGIILNSIDKENCGSGELNLACPNRDTDF